MSDNRDILLNPDGTVRQPSWNIPGVDASREATLADIAGLNLGRGGGDVYLRPPVGTADQMAIPGGDITRRMESLQEYRRNWKGGQPISYQGPVNVGMFNPTGTPYVTADHAFAFGANAPVNPLTRFLEPQPTNSLFPTEQRGIQYLSQGPIGPISMSQSIDPALTFIEGSGANEAFKRRVQEGTDVALSFGPGVIAGRKAKIPETFQGPDTPSVLEQAIIAEMGMHPNIPNDRDAIFGATGWYRGVDDKWKFIVPDEGARLRTENMRMTPYKNIVTGEDSPIHGIPFGKDLKLPDVLEHPTLFDAYPHLKDVSIKPMPLGSILDTKGAYQDNKIWLTGQSEENALSTLLHEVQHAVQDHEGFARGGNVGEFLPKTHDADMESVKEDKEMLEKQMHDYGVDPFHVAGVHGLYPHESPLRLVKEAHDAVNSLPQYLVDSYKDVMGRYRNLMDQKDAAFRNYSNLGGEVEARFVQSMLHHHRWDAAPWQWSKVTPESEQIIKFRQSGGSLTPVEHNPFEGVGGM